MFSRQQCNNENGVRIEKLSIFAQIAWPFGKPIREDSFDKMDMEVAHWFVLNNCDETITYLDEHEELMKWEHPAHLYA